MNSGVYKISSLIDNRVYVGSAKDFNKRSRSHFLRLKKNEHHSIKLQNFYNKYGRDALLFEIIENCEIEKLIEREQHYIDTLNPFFNILRIAYSSLGRISPMKGKRHSEETKKLIGEANAKRMWSEESKTKSSESKKGKKMPPDFAAKIALVNKGRKRSSETKRKMSLAGKGRIIPEKTRLAIAEANRNRVFTDEARKRMSIALTGRFCSEESRKKRSDTMKQTLLKKKLK